jgi:hypothetical protein
MPAPIPSSAPPRTTGGRPRARPARRAGPVVLSYGLGVDSTAVLLRWLEEPDSRDFSLEQLLVVTAMTGDQWATTGEHVTRYILPRLKAAGIRYAQVARRSAFQADGIVVLDDSPAPRQLHLDGAYKLSDELTAAGTVPQCGGARLCSCQGQGLASRHVSGAGDRRPVSPGGRLSPR